MNEPRQQNLKPPHLSWYLRQVPDDSVAFPRDRKKLTETEDILFYAKLVSNLTSDIKSIDICKRAAQTGSQFEHLLRDRGGTLYTPIGRQIIVSSADLRLVRRMKVNDAKEGFLDRFFGLREAVRSLIRALHPSAPAEGAKTSREFPGGAIERFEPDDQPHIQIGDLLLVDHLTIYEKNIDRMNSDMKWALHAEQDPVLDGIDNLPMAEERIFSRNPPQHFDVICPIDGYVTLAPVRYISPRWTWKDMCGRDFCLHVCPHCLAVFHRELLRMS